jgi:drug/metabolite transporter (DMT)-like permease
MPAALRSRLTTIAAYAAMVSIWGTTWLGIKVSLGGFPAITGAGVRFIVAGLVLYALALAVRTDLRKQTPPLHLIAVLALTMFGLNYALTYIAETHLASGLVAVLFGTMPFFIFAFAHVLVGERATPATFLGAGLALCGVALISLVGNLHGDLLYVVAVVAASASSGFANVYLKRFAHANPLATLPPAMLLAGVAMTAWGLGFERIDPSHAFAFASVAALLYLAILGSAVAFVLNHWLLQRIDAGAVGLSALIIPVIAVAVGAGFAHEVLTPRDFIGAALVLGGVWVALRGSASQPAELRAAA